MTGSLVVFIVLMTGAGVTGLAVANLLGRRGR